MSALKDITAGTLANGGQNSSESVLEAPEYSGWSIDDWTSSQTTYASSTALWGLEGGFQQDGYWRAAEHRRRRRSPATSK